MALTQCTLVPSSRRLQQSWTLRGDDHRRRNQPSSSIAEVVVDDDAVDGEREIAPMIQDSGDRGLDSTSTKGVDSLAGVVNSPTGIDSHELTRQVPPLSTFQTQRKTLKQVPKVIVEDGFERYAHHDDNYEEPARGNGRIAQQLSSTDRESRV